MAGLGDGPPPRTAHGPKCQTGKLIRALDDEDRATLGTWMADESIATTDLHRRLAEHVATNYRDVAWLVPSVFTLNRHRHGRCGCGRAS